MAPIQYSLHYEDYSEHLMSRFGKLLQMQSMVDMTLMCSSHTLRVHKAVLAASSAYFQEVLQKQTGEPLIILKIRFSVLKCLVEFMYCGKTQCLEENLDDLVSAAQFLKIKGLSKVTKEGLGINNHSELPVFTPPVVINRPPQSLIDLHSQDNSEAKVPSTQLSSSTTNQTTDSLNRNTKDMVVRIPFDIEGGTGLDYADPSRGARPRRGRPSFKRPAGWESGTGLGRAAERALLRREQDSRKAIHQLKHLQTRHMQEYVDRVTLSQAVNSICKNDTSQSFLNIDNDLMYMDQTMPSNPLDSTVPYTKDSLGNETITSKYSTPTGNSASIDTSNGGINTAMSQYVNALKSAGLPTDLPILFESGDGSYINVNEQVLLDMVQSSEIQYEVIEQPNIIEKVADPSEIKSIDELSKSIERGEMLIGTKNFTSTSDYTKDNSQETINSLNAILSDNLESFGEQQNYVVLDHNLQDTTHNPINNDNANDFSCIENDMQFFTKSMSDDVKNYYEEQQLNDSRGMDQFCPTNTSLESSFNMSLLDTKSSHLSDNISQQYNTLNSEDLKRNDDCYDFSLQLPHPNDFKEDALDCLMSPKANSNHGNYIEDNLESRVQDRDEIIKDLMNIESKIAMENSNSDVISEEKNDSYIRLNTNTMDSTLSDIDKVNQTTNEMPSSNTDFPDVSECDLKWEISGNDNTDENDSTELNKSDDIGAASLDLNISQSRACIIADDINSSADITAEKCESKEYIKEIIKTDDELDPQTSSTLDENIPFAVGLLPLNQIQELDDENFLKRKNSYDMLDDDAKCLKRKIKYKKM